jgi:gamma-glutamyltranspeptidase/glutathione hydrolase
MREDKNFVSLRERLFGFLTLIFLSVGVLSAAQHYAEGEKAMVVASTPEAAQAGLSILRLGGNAVDAAAATAFALMVTDPAMCSLGGRSQIMIHLSGGKVIGLDGTTQAPRLALKPAKAGEGYRTCPVPGSPAALEEMVVRYGSLPLKTILGPAIRLAKEGFVINKAYHEFFRKYGASFRLYPGTALHFLKEDGTFFVEGEKFCQPALARTLEAIAAEGSGAFYRGKLAEAIVQDMISHGGLIKRDDLAQYKTLPGKVLEGSYRGYQVLSRGDQCNGASTIETLHILEQFPPQEFKPGDPQWLHLLAQATYIGNADEYLPDWQQTSKALAARRMREIDKARALPVPVQPKDIQSKAETTHLSVIDEKGNMVALTQSIGPSFGSKVVNPELGFFYAYSYDMNDEPLPYQREKTSQSPTIVLKSGKPFLVLGSAGSSRIPASIVQTVVNIIDLQMALEKAISSPRLFLTDQELRLESFGLPETTLQKLKGLGYSLKLYDGLQEYFGRVHAIHIDEAGRKVYGAADPRGYGAAAGY